MKIRIIKTQADYIEAVNYLEEIDTRPDFEDNEDLINEFDLIADLVEMYEKEHYPINPGHPIEVIKLKMAYMDLKQKDLSPQIASKGVISEIMNKKRAMSKDVIRKFSKLLKLDQEVLNLKYDLCVEKKASKQKNKIFNNLSETIVNFQNLVRNNGMILNI